MNYTKLQKTVASFLLPLFFFGLVFRFPFGDFFTGIKAANPKINSLVSILVNEDIYSGVESSIKRYAEDIQNQLSKTRVVIIPVPSDATTFEIASLNENLYYEGYKGLTGNVDFESELIGSVFVGNIPSPIVFDGNKSSKTIVPFIDFEDKKYIYNHETKVYETNSNNIDGINAEIWHGLIVPNKETQQEDIDAINGYFDKNHDFYQGQGNFTYLKGTINGNIGEKISDKYEPYVFYFDEFREQASLSYSQYQGYEAYLDNKEDLVYSRYSKELAQSIQDRVLGTQSNQIKELIGDLDPEVTDISALNAFSSEGPDISDTSAISTRFITNNVTKQFLETLNSSTLGEFKKDVYNAGRYNGTGSKVNVDTIPYLISVLDTIGDNVIKGANNKLEKEIDKLVIESGLSRKIIVPTGILVSGSSCSARRYTNFLYGKSGDDLKTALDCTMYRGSTENGGTLVEANRGYNIDNVQGDIDLCKDIGSTSIGKTNGFWGGNSPLNFNNSTFQSGKLALNNSNTKQAIVPLFDIKGSKKITDGSKVPSPLNCFDNNYLLSYSEVQLTTGGNDNENTQCVPGYRLPISGNSSLGWTCGSTNQSFDFGLSFDENYDRISQSSLGGTCDIISLNINGAIVKRFQGDWAPSGEGDLCVAKTTNYSYKTIPSHIEHKSATNSELGSQTSAMITPNLPIDKDRYIDFIGAGGEYAKISYPYLYRIGKNIQYTGEFSDDYQTIKDLIQNEIETKSTEINEVINSNSPVTLSGEKLDIYNNYLSNGVYPSASFDLNDFVPKGDNDFTQDGDTKSISYYDTLAFAIYWNNLDSVSQKYKFVIENYLSDQFKSDDSYALAKHKKSYEIAYLGAPGDAQNMYVTLDPESKGVNPYADIVSQNLLINSDLMSANLDLVDENTPNQNGAFKCTPPEGIPIWEWIPAVMCWMEDILPPKIKVGKTSCSTKTLFDDKSESQGIYNFGQNNADAESGYCSDDLTSNGVSDCLEEEIKNAKLKLKSSTIRAGYGENIGVEVGLFDDDDIAIEGINFVKTTFELVNISVPLDDTKDFNELNSKEVYNIDRLNEKSLREASKYVSFNTTEIPLSGGRARYNFSAKNKDADVYIRSKIVLSDKDGNIIKELSSEDIKIQIRQTTFSLSSRIINQEGEINMGTLGVLANDNVNVFFHDGNQGTLDSFKSRIQNSGIAKDKLVLSLSHFNKKGLLPIAYPLTVRYLHNGKQIREDGQINTLSGVGFSKLVAFSESGEYTIIIKDNEGKTISEDFTILSDEISNVEIELGSTDIEVDGNITNNVLFLKDQYGNIVQGKPYTVSMELLSGGLYFPSDVNEGTIKKNLTVYRGLQVFRLQPTGIATTNKLNVVVKSGEKIIRNVSTIITHNSINASINASAEIKVGGEDVNFTLEFRDNEGNLLDDFSSRAYVNVNPLYGSVKAPYIKIKNGVANMVFNTSNVSGENIPLGFNIEGLSKTIRKNITILPGKPMKIDLILSQSKMEATAESESTLKVELKDRYNNLVTNDSTTSFAIEVEDESKKILSSSTYLEKAVKGEATFVLKASSNPGTAYVKVTSTPDLSTNRFTVGSGSTAVEVKGVGVNSTQVKTYYLWNKEHIDGNNFNGLYSVLLGAEYGDYTQKDYLAGSLLFDKSNRSLAVTSLLNNPYGFTDSIIFGKNGGAYKQISSGDLSQDVELNVEFDINNKMYLDANNKATNTYIGKIHYNLPSNTILKTCVGKKNDFTDCDNDVENTSITLKSLSNDYNISSLAEELTFAEVNGNTLFKISKDMSFVVHPSIDLEIDSANQDGSLVLNIVSGNNVIGKLSIKFKNHEYFVTRSSVETKTKRLINRNSIIAELKSYMYGSRDTYLGDGSSTLAVYYNDPFRDETAMSNFSSDTFSGIENFETEKGIGWSGDNGFLLNFAAGETVGESVQDYVSFGTVTLGDPVINLKKIKKNFNDSLIEKSFDSTVGTLLSNEEIEGYQIFDYNNDGKIDILLIKNDGYVKLLENRGDGADFLDKGELLYIADYGKSSYIKAGDFSGDGFGDIFFINNKGEPFLFENTQKDFVRVSLQDTFDLNAKIVQVEMFNMDNDSDNKQDLVTLDDAGNITIFYGNTRTQKEKFTKNNVGTGYGITLNSDPRTDGALIYFDGLVQIDEQDLLDTLALENEELALKPTGNNDRLIDGIMFEKINYSAGSKSELSTNSSIIDSIPLLKSTEFGTSSVDTTEAISKFLSSHSGSTQVQGTNSVDITTFIKSEYSQAAGIIVQKTFDDINGDNLQSGDLVEVTVSFTNDGDSTKEGIVYVDSVTSPFEMAELPVVKDESIIERGAPSGYNLLLDGIVLAPDQTRVIKYTLRVLPITFGHIEVGLFEEKGIVGDDQFGDIIIKDDNKNCSQAVDMFRSLTSNTYSEKEETYPRCDDSKLMLPEVLEKNKIDTDNNGIPDYIDEITDNLDKQKEFAEQAFIEMKIDTDGDGIPDDEDSTPNFNADELGGILDPVNEKIDDMTEGIDTMIEGFGCGFGGDSCYSTPLNWAPLAPGQDPTLFGNPVGDGLKVGEGVPIFSAFTGMPITGWGCVEVPSVWPVSSHTFDGVCYGVPGAGGSKGVNSPTNFVRVFATPTLTGGAGVAACFGGPASVAGNSIPKGISPLIPGGNCIVYAKPLLACNNDGSEGDPESLGLATDFGGSEGFGVVNANCYTGLKGQSGGNYSNEAFLEDDFAESYYKYKDSDFKSEVFAIKYDEALEKISEGGGIKTKNMSLVKGGKSGEYEFSVGLDFSGDTQGNFVDVQQIRKQRVASFPSFLMDWATRQIEEFVTKLTDFPTLFVILPDFGGIVDTDWGEHISKGMAQAYDEGKQTEEQRIENIKAQTDSINSSKSGLDCNGEDQIQCLSLDVEMGKLQVRTRDDGVAGGVGGAKKAFSGIRSVYDFLGNIPLVSIKPQQVNVEIPWVDQNTLNKTLLDWKITQRQWLSQSVKVEGSVNISASSKADYSKLIENLDKNIQTLEEYREIPAQLSTMFNKKEEWLGQILCSVESVSTLTGGWIDDNGKRFKAWIELYVLIKAILKSWQMLIDVFQDYDAECHECKNERNDLLNYEFKLIDMIIPKLPVIQFPKWPDIILDLHNIRAGLSIKIPDFNVTQRPIILPTLPELKLPDFDGSIDASADFNFDFPEMPLLDGFDIPELGDMPGIPSVELPNLPPPPTLPKIFSSLKGILKVLKLVVKAMCILKSSPFVPEWRAGDQIAFLTERNGYLPTDFLDLSLPEFSLPFVDSIKVTTWVNFEVETDFMVEMAKQIVDPINSTSSDLVNKFSNAGLDSLDFSSYSESKSIDENIEESIDISKIDVKDISIGMFTKMLATGVINIFTYIENEQDETVTSKEFLRLVNESLADESITSNPRMKGVITLWENVNKMTYHKEDMLIKDLKENSREKFEALSLVIEKEIQKTKDLKESFERSTTPELFKEVVGETKNNDFREYEKILSKYNKNYLESAKKLLNNGEDAEVKNIREEGEHFLTRVNGGLNLYKEGLINYNNYIEEEKLLSQASSTNVGFGGVNSCQAQKDSEYSYNYKGLYIIEKDKSYRLFDYIDDLSGNEEYTSIDFDQDEDIDLLYIANGKLFLKENLSIQEVQGGNSDTILVVMPEKNKFFNGEFVEAINGFREKNTDNKSINISFNAPTNSGIKHFVYEYYTTIDRFSSEEMNDYRPEGVSKNIIEAFVLSDEQVLEMGESGTIERRNSVRLSYIGNMSGIHLDTAKMIQLSRNLGTEISRGTRVYTGNNDTRIIYVDSNNVEQEYVIEKHSSLEFNNNVVITNIYAGDVYVKSDDRVLLKGTQEISKYIGLPLFPGSKIESIPDLRGSFNEQSNIEIAYSSKKEALGISFGDVDSYEIYDLGQQSSDYLIKLDRNNDFLYGKIFPVFKGIIGTYTNQKLSSPQIQADTYAPELNFNEIIKIPVYQERIIDLTEFIYENSGFSSIKRVDVDFDLEIDSSGDGNPRNDSDTNGIELLPLNTGKLRIKFGEFDELIKKKIGITLSDNNGNVGFKEVDFEVYAPIPEIASQDENVVQGDLDEDLIGEPVNLYRLRGGSIKQLENAAGSKIVSTLDDGVYNFNIAKSGSGLTLMQDGLAVATVDENTGKITKKNLNLEIEAGIDNLDYPSIIILDESGGELYRQSIKLLENREVVIRDSFSDIVDNGMFLKFMDTSNFAYYKIPTGVEHSAGSIVIHKKGDISPIISLFPDGRLKGINELYTLVYKDFGNYTSLGIIDSISNSQIAEVLYKINGSYLMR